ncbi:hypothetical protein HDU91_004252 [Kappamyces sp. JEL0680]|nr:hypothetical protein HDU91_004252 [Kappamyces sp. JEL0680]
MIKLPEIPRHKSEPLPQRCSAKSKSFSEKEKNYWIHVENTRLVKKLYKNDTRAPLYPHYDVEKRLTSHQQKMKKAQEKIAAENRVRSPPSAAIATSPIELLMRRKKQIDDFDRHQRWVTMMSEAQQKKMRKKEDDSGARYCQV